MFELCLEQRSEQVLRILGDYVSVFLILTNCNILVNRSNIQLQSDESDRILIVCLAADLSQSNLQGIHNKSN